VLQGHLESLGAPEVQCLHRSELAGILGIISHIHKLCDDHDIQEGSVTICCDGIGAIQRICSDYLSKSFHKHFDIINSIKISIRPSPLHWKFMHVKGHQDDYKLSNDLDRPAQLNTIADNIAKAKLTSLLHQEQ
jgi:hypothetical protein